MTARIFAVLAALALSACGSKATPGSAAATATPESAAKLYGDALRTGDYAAAARLMHPSALRQWRSLFEPLFTRPEMEESATQMFGLPREALAGTPDTVLFAAFLKNVLAGEEGLAEMMNAATIDPLGHVAQGDTMLVVTRTTITLEGASITQFDVMPFMLDQGRWWALLKADVTNMAAMIQRAANERS